MNSVLSQNPPSRALPNISLLRTNNTQHWYRGSPIATFCCRWGEICLGPTAFPLHSVEFCDYGPPTSCWFIPTARSPTSRRLSGLVCHPRHPLRLFGIGPTSKPSALPAPPNPPLVPPPGGVIPSTLALDHVPNPNYDVPSRPTSPRSPATPHPSGFAMPGVLTVERPRSPTTPVGMRAPTCNIEPGLYC